MTTVILIFFIIFLYFLSMRFIAKIIDKMSKNSASNSYRVKYINKTINIALFVFYVLLLFFLLGIEYTHVAVFLSSIFAVLGVGFFAQWSILSNITASLIIFFAFPYRVGDRVKIVDKDEDISGVIVEISLFHLILRREDGHQITYPNNLVLQKAVIKLKHRLPVQLDMDMNN